MRFCLIGPTYPMRGGIAHYTAMLTRQLRKSGHEVLLYAFSSGYPHWLYPGKINVDPSQRPLRITPHHLIVPWSPWSWVQSAQCIKADKPDAVIVEWWVPYWAPMQLALTTLLRRSGLPVFMDCQNVLPHDLHPFARLITARTLRTANACLVYSREHQQELLTVVPGMPHAIVPFPAYGDLARADFQRTTARQSLGLNGPVALFFGFVRPYKGLQVLLHSLAELVFTVPLHLLIVGEFWQERSGYDQLICQLNLQSRITIIDAYVPDEDLGRYFSAADVLILPYLTHVQSGVLALAQAFQKPVIASRVGGLADGIIDGQTGLLVEPNDVHALTQAIQRFFQEELGDAMVPSLQAMHPETGWAQVVETWVALSMMVKS